MAAQQDEALVAAIASAAAGDEQAFARIVAAHHDDLTRIAFVICRDPDLAADARPAGLVDRLAPADAAS